MTDDTQNDDGLPVEGSAPAKADASRPSRAKRHLRLVPVTGEPETPKAKTKTGKGVTKSQRSAPDPLTGLTEKQAGFVAGIEKGLSLTDSYKAAYDTSGMTQKQCHEEACKLFAHPKIARRLREISEEKAAQLRMMSVSDAAAAVEVFRRMMLTADTDASKIRAAELLAKASGVFTEKVEFEDKTDRSTSDIEQSIKDRLARLGLTG